MHAVAGTVHPKYFDMQGAVATVPAGTPGFDVTLLNFDVTFAVRSVPAGTLTLM